MSSFFFFSSRRRHTRFDCDWSSDVCSSDLAGDVLMPPGETEKSLKRLEDAVHAVAAAGAIPLVLGGGHTVTFPDATGVARHVGWGRGSLIHFDAHAGTGDIQCGSRCRTGTPMRRLIGSRRVSGHRC